MCVSSDVATKLLLISMHTFYCVISLSLLIFLLNHYHFTSSSSSSSSSSPLLLLLLLLLLLPLLLLLLLLIFLLLLLFLLLFLFCHIVIMFSSLSSLRWSHVMLCGDKGEKVWSSQGSGKYPPPPLSPLLCSFSSCIGVFRLIFINMLIYMDILENTQRRFL